MATVQSVRGQIDSTALGKVLMHEHVFVLSEEIRQNYPNYWDEEERVADAVRKLKDLAARGISTIVDPTLIGMGRYIPRLQRINEQVDINIIAATGLYTYNDVPFHFHYQGPGLLFDTSEPMVELFVHDITEGIADTSVKAELLKCAIDAQGMTPGVERVMRAVAKAHIRTGAPITVHTDAQSRTGLLAQRLLAEEGVDLTRVVIGHAGDSADLDYLVQLADSGSLLGMDRFGLDAFLPFDQRVDTVAELARRGYANRMVLSQDSACYIDWFSPEQRAAVAPNWHYTHVSDDVLPALRERDVTEEQITAMLEDNPRRYFERG
ncbi:phosphotriesterase family protein [Actinomadura terrae]|uniref:phosphotriesterase family protein n=1 Tax=Actinomadura terrae TaxID=604353 RepID=UPI001FA7E65D|nr:phosphotriesterase-related protein [Actinomadura terrae]